jgi:hypothetical protein
MQSINLTDHFLIAMPALVDSFFSKTLVYIAEHNNRGALGVIVNRPIDMSLGTLFEKIDVPLQAQGFANLPVLFGGPVQTDRGFVLHRPVGQWQSTLAINSEVGLTSSRDVLLAVARDGQPRDLLDLRAVERLAAEARVGLAQLEAVELGRVMAGRDGLHRRADRRQHRCRDAGRQQRAGGRAGGLLRHCRGHPRGQLGHEHMARHLAG